MELVNVLRYCHALIDHKESDDYQDDVMLKMIQFGVKTKEKMLIFDMDETLVAAKFEGYTPLGFEPTFTFPFKDSQVHVRLRPYL